MKTNEFQRTLVTELVPRGRRCEWCGKPAEHQWTVMGGKHHNQGDTSAPPARKHSRR